MNAGNAVDVEIGTLLRIGGKLCKVVGRGASGNTIVLHALPQRVWRPATIQDAKEFRRCRVRDYEGQAWMESCTLVSCSIEAGWYAVRNDRSMIVSTWKQCQVEDDA